MGYGSSARESVELRSAGSSVQEMPEAVAAFFGFFFAGLL
jgi:hypothetical protein